MRENYDSRMLAALKGFEAGAKGPGCCCMCCACGSAVIEQLSRQLDITLFYYNPNIDTRRSTTPGPVKWRGSSS